MLTYPLAPHWRPGATTVVVALAGLLVLGALVAAGLRVTARSEPRRALAREVGRRVIGWWWVLLVLVPSVLAGGVLVLALFALAAAVGWVEFAGLNREAGLTPRAGVWAVPLLAVFFGVCVPVRTAGALGPGVLLAGVVLLAAKVFRPAARAAALWRAAGWLACVVPLGTAALIGLRFGTAWLAFVIVIAQAGDVLQYAFGKAFGRHRLAPTLSPGKTWEGLFGGLGGALVLGALLAPYIHQSRPAAMALGAGFAAAGALGGLAMSAAKRHHAAKDFGHWLPGHGGLMDRFDSLCGAALLAYLWLAR